MSFWSSFKRGISFIPGSVRLYQFILSKRLPEVLPTKGLMRGRMPSPDLSKLKLEYRQGSLYHEPDTFVLYRIIGNDLTPRHRKGQSRENLKFILENESQFADCEKRFVVNRIVDTREEDAILNLLEKAKCAYLHLPFQRKEYQKLTWDIEGVPEKYAPYTKSFDSLSKAEQGRVLMRIYKNKNNYVMNNNGARNAALNEGRLLAKWVLPWDGNCFITEKGWQDIMATIKSSPEIPYYIVPMARIIDNQLLIDSDFKPDALEEPQVIFRRDSTLFFNEAYFYGRRPKVELLWRLGVPGDWDKWMLEPWDLPDPKYSCQAGTFAYSGWVARLESGKQHLETDPVQGKVDRGLARNEAIAFVIDHLDLQKTTKINFDQPLIVQFSEIPSQYCLGPNNGLLELLFKTAEEALGRGPYSVVNKTTLAPSQDPHDYWHPAPYYWPNPLTPTGLPYISRDGIRVPGTRLYEQESEKYDRTSLQRLFDDTLVLAMAWKFFGEKRFAQHGAQLIQAWFLDPSTAMNPHLKYAQVRMGHNKNMGSSSGIIEMKDLYFFLDAVRLLQNGNFLSSTEKKHLKKWFIQYLNWLGTSPQGLEERAACNNHGLYYDLQIASIAAFLKNAKLLRDTFRNSRFRILKHFDQTGYQPEEMTRTTTAHYCCFNLQGWIHLSQLADSCGEDLWNFHGTDGRGIRKGMDWLLKYLGKDWPYQQIDTFDSERLYPIYYACMKRYGLPEGMQNLKVPNPNDIKPLFYPHDGIRPFWQLGIIKGFD